MPTSTMVARHCRADSRQFLDSSTANFPTHLGKLAVAAQKLTVFRCKLSGSGQIPVWTPGTVKEVKLSPLFDLSSRLLTSTYDLSCDFAIRRCVGDWGVLVQ